MARKRPGANSAPMVVAVVVVFAFLALILAEYGFNASALIGLGSANPVNAPATLPDGLLIVFHSDGS